MVDDRNVDGPGRAQDIGRPGRADARDPARAEDAVPREQREFGRSEREDVGPAERQEAGPRGRHESGPAEREEARPAAKGLNGQAEAEAESAGSAAATGGGADAAAAAADGARAEALTASDEAAEQLEALQSELGLLNDRHLRLAADFDNYRKRIARERTELWARSQAELVKPLLEVLDDLQRVVAYEDEAASVEALTEGARLVEKKFRHVLESAGLEPIDPWGEFFNPATMEALMTVPAEHPEEDEVVADVFQKGYRFGDVLIRPAKVRVKKYEEAPPRTEA